MHRLKIKKRRKKNKKEGKEFENLIKINMGDINIYSFKLILLIANLIIIKKTFIKSQIS